MSERIFRELLKARWDKGCFVCVGLDAEYGKIPAHLRAGDEADALVVFNRAIVDATRDVACAYKPNSAFYEAHGEQGWKALAETVHYIHTTAPEVPVILDAKRADIGSTNAGYIQAAFEDLKADAITLHPYLGSEALQPFLERKDKGIIILCRTSNPGAGEFQDLQVEGKPLYQVVAHKVATQWNKNQNCALVVGATYPEEMQAVRSIVGDMPILIPGIGAQGGDLEKAVNVGKDAKGQGMMINSSRGIIYASGGEDFAEAARREALQLHTKINEYR